MLGLLPGLYKRTNSNIVQVGVKIYFEKSLKRLHEVPWINKSLSIDRNENK